MALDFLAGCAGGAAGVIVGHPLDTVKVRLQTQAPGNMKYRGTFQTLSMIVKQESVFGLYKGIASPLVGVAGINAIIFGVYGLLRPYVAEAPGNDALWAHFVAGAISGSVQSVACSPMELVKIRMQTNESSVKQSSLDVLKNIYKREGGLFRGVYKGWLSTLLREIPGFGSYFATYEFLTTKTGYQVGTFGMMMAGGMAGVVSWIFCFPIDVVKTRIQMDTSKKYSGILDCARQTFKAEGHQAFFRGLNSSVIRAFPTNAATFTVVNWIMRYATQKQGDLQTGRQELAYLLEEWDVARIRSKEFYNTMNWARVPSYNYLSAQCLLPQSSTIQQIETSLRRINSMFNDRYANSSQEGSSEDVSNYDDKLNNSEEYSFANNNKNQSKEVIEPTTTLTSSCQISQENNMNIDAKSNSSLEKETLVVSNKAKTYHLHETGSQETKMSSSSSSPSNSFYNIFTRWLQDFTLTPVHFCKCVDNCSCRF